jgi:hypothetical protein
VTATARKLATAAQLARLYGPAMWWYSIEETFAKLKAFLRAARPRTFDQVLALVAAALELFTPDECGNYIRHSGYRLAVQL